MIQAASGAPLSPSSQRVGNSREISNFQESDVKVEEKKFSVFQCKGCRSIVGDNSKTLASDFDSNFVTVQVKNDNVLVENDLETSKSGPDYGCTFNLLRCDCCKAFIGRSYLTTRSQFDNLRGCYSFSLDSIIIFELARLEGFEPLSNAEQTISKNALSPENIEITKLQKFVLALYDRLELVEIENDSLKAEIENLSSRIEDRPTDYSFSEGFLPGSQKPKTRKPRSAKRNSVDASEVQRHVLSESLKPVLPSGSVETQDKSRMLQNIAEDSLFETISWEILRNNQVKTVLEKIKST